jgi:GTP-binding protein
MRSSNFIDQVTVYVRSGKGGAGSAHLHRAKFIPKGGPDGGDGGRGGHIIVKGNMHMSTLLHLRYKRHIMAPNGENGKDSRKFGAMGQDIIIEVPLGTVINTADTAEYILEVLEHDKAYILAQGGRGGLGNVHFKSSTNQTPRYAQPGESGAEMWVTMELKLLADVGLVGMPNAGKSTLLSVLSAAKPKIADYPFTTLEPQLGIVAYEDNKSFVMADIPGILEGAAEGKGLGLQFLRHIERNAVLLFVVPASSINVKAEYDLLVEEVGKYSAELINKPRLLAVSKVDMCNEKEQKKISNDLDGYVEYVFISSIQKKGLDQLKHKIWRLMQSS